MIRDTKSVAVINVHKIEELIDSKINALYATLLPEGTREDEFVRILVMLHAKSWKLLFSMEFSRAKIARNKVMRMGALREVHSSRIRIIDMILLNSFEQECRWAGVLAPPQDCITASATYTLEQEHLIDRSQNDIWTNNGFGESVIEPQNLIQGVRETLQITQLLSRNDFFNFFYDSLFVISGFVERGEETNAELCRSLLIQAFNRLSSFQIETKKIEELIGFAIPMQNKILTLEKLKNIRDGGCKN